MDDESTRVVKELEGQLVSMEVALALEIRSDKDVDRNMLGVAN